nr:hypothetical protein [Tanacetum cinerariifolium]
MKLNELMEVCTNLQTRVIGLEKTKTTQALDIASLKRRVKKLEKKQRSRTHKIKRLYKVSLTARVDSSKDEQSLGEDASKQGRKINDIDADEDITLVNDQDDAKMLDVNDLHGEEVFVEKEVADKEVNEEVQKDVEEVAEDTNTGKLIVDVAQVSVAGEVNVASFAKIVSAAATITTEKITLAQALVEIKTSKTKAKGIVLQEPSESITTTATTISSKKSHEKEFDEEQRIAREKAEKEIEANIALIEEWDDIQAKIDVDYQLAQRLIKVHLNDVGITAVHIDVNSALMELVLLVNFKDNILSGYYYWYKKHMIVAGADNRPPMLEKIMYNSWQNRIFHYIKEKEHGRISLTQLSSYHLFMALLKAMNIVLQDLPPEVYSLVNHHHIAKEIWHRVKLLMKGMKLSQQECECKLHNEFDRFTSSRVQVNTKFLNSLPPEWSKFVTNVKLANNMHTSNYDQLYAYLSQHEAHATEVNMDDPNITMEECIRLDEEKASRNAIVFDDAFTSKVTPSYEPTVSPLNDNKIDFRISFDESDDEDYT